MDTLSNLSVSTTKVFADFTLAPDVLEALKRAGLDKPTPIQEKCIPPICEGKDVVGKAETGTGKTIGFAAPMIGRIDTNRVAVQAIVLTPTRELAQQVAGVFEELGADRNLGVALVVGGVHASEQVLKLRSGSQVVVGTPGRVLEFLQDRTLSLVWCETVVLDEADRMLDMGFIDDVTKILDAVPEERQTLVFSATVPPEVKRLLQKYMKKPEVHSTSSGLTTVPEIKQMYVEAEFPQKFKALQKLLDSRPDDTFIVFCNTRRQAIDLDRMLWGHGYSAGALHGDREQDARFRILESFRNGDIKILVATDVASRGLDIDDVGCVVNYEIPDESEGYVHRIGRTGRAQKSGLALSLVASKEWASWQRVLRDTGFPVERSGPERVRKSRVGGGRMGGTSRTGRSSRGGAVTGGRRGSRPGRRRSRDESIDPPAAEVETTLAIDSGGNGQSPPPEGTVMEKAENEHRWEEPEAPSRGPGSGDSPEDTGQVESGSEVPGDTGEGGQKTEAQGEDGRPRRRKRRGRGGRSRQRQQEPEGEKKPRDEGLSKEKASGGANTEPARRKRRGEPRGGSTPSQEGASESKDESLRALKERARQPKPSRLRLEEVDDDFVKTDYFSVDHSIIERAGAESSTPSRRGRGRSGGGGESRGTRSKTTEKAAAGGKKEAAGTAKEGEGRPAKTTRKRRRRRRPAKGADSGGASSPEGS